MGKCIETLFPIVRVDKDNEEVFLQVVHPYQGYNIYSQMENDLLNGERL